MICDKCGREHHTVHYVSDFWQRLCDACEEEAEYAFYEYDAQRYGDDEYWHD